MLKPVSLNLDLTVTCWISSRSSVKAIRGPSPGAAETGDGAGSTSDDATTDAVTMAASNIERLTDTSARTARTYTHHAAESAAFVSPVRGQPIGQRVACGRAHAR